jgi:hypothetical protein
VLGLREKIGGDPGRISKLIGNDHGFGWTGKTVEADKTEDLLLG